MRAIKHKSKILNYFALKIEEKSFFARLLGIGIDYFVVNKM